MKHKHYWKVISKEGLSLRCNCGKIRNTEEWNREERVWYYREYTPKERR